MKHQFGEKFVQEVQYWWAFSCLVLAGRRNAADFRGELLRRSADSYATPEQVGSIVDEAVTFLAEVLNVALSERQSHPVPVSGWEKHLPALSTGPEGDASASREN